jgi:hypothetical protein
MYRVMKRISLITIVLAVVFSARAEAQGWGSCWFGCSPEGYLHSVADLKNLTNQNVPPAPLVADIWVQLFGWCKTNSAAESNCTDNSTSNNFVGPNWVHVPQQVVPSDPNQAGVYPWLTSLLEWINHDSHPAPSYHQCPASKVEIPTAFYPEQILFNGTRAGNGPNNVKITATCSWTGSVAPSTCQASSSLYDCTCTIKRGAKLQQDVPCNGNLDPRDYPDPVP